MPWIPVENTNMTLCILQFKNLQLHVGSLMKAERPSLERLSIFPSFGFDGRSLVLIVIA